VYNGRMTTHQRDHDERVEQPEPLGQRIAQLRARRGWTQTDLAERLAVSRVAVSHFEIGLALPSERTVVLLAGLFKLAPHELVAGTGYPAAKTERLPSVACLHTEVELQLALLERDLAWLERWQAAAGRAPLAEVVAGWQATLAELERRCYDAHERALLHAACERLLLFNSPRRHGGHGDIFNSSLDP
jgi:transcriptional regulator with XRE-family HTH domain